MLRTYTRPALLTKLHGELRAAFPSIAFGIEGYSGDVIHVTIPADTAPATVAQIDAIVNAHDPTPIPIISGEVEIKPRSIRTTGNGTVELFRATLETRCGYDSELTVIGIDAANGASRKTKVSVSVGRWDAGAVHFTGSPSVLANHSAGASPPAAPPAPVVSGNDFMINVTGTAGRTIDWVLFGTVRRFRPGGF